MNPPSSLRVLRGSLSRMGGHCLLRRLPSFGPSLHSLQLPAEPSGSQRPARKAACQWTLPLSLELLSPGQAGRGCCLPPGSLQGPSRVREWRSSENAWGHWASARGRAWFSLCCQMPLGAMCWLPHTRAALRETFRFILRIGFTHTCFGGVLFFRYLLVYLFGCVLVAPLSILS